MAAFSWFRRTTRSRPAPTAVRSRLRLRALEDRVVPATFDIADGDINALIAAINSSNTNTEADTINLASNGTYTFTDATDTADGGNALPSITGNQGAANDVITINGNSSTLTRSGTNNFRFFRVAGGANAATLNLNALTLSNGSVSGSTGGAILLAGGNGTFTTCTFSGNAADGGGAISDTGAGTTLTLRSCTITGNTAASGDGGGVLNNGADVTINGGTFSNNSANAGGGFRSESGAVSIDSCNVTGNTAMNGTGGGISIRGNATITFCAVSNNTAGGDGGGAFVQGNLTAANNSFTTNICTGAGGGVASTAGALVMTNCTLNGNSADAGGGGASATTPAGVTTTVSLCTVGENVTLNGAGGGLLFQGFGRTYQLYNTVVAGNDNGGRAADGPDVSGTVESLGYNFLGIGDGVTFTGITTGNQAGTNRTPIDPLLGPLQNNGGRTLTRLPATGSRLINLGDPGFTTPPDTDQRGTGFARVQTARIDIGAVEIQPPLVADIGVTKTDGRSTVAQGATTTYTVVVRNAGPGAVSGITITDNVPNGAASATFTSTVTGGASGNTASGSGAIGDTLSLPANSTVTYTIIVSVAATATGTLRNTASVTLPGNVSDPNPANNSATDNDTITIGGTGGTGGGGGGTGGGGGGGGANSQIVAFAQDAGFRPVVNLYDASTSQLQRSFLAYGSNFRGGVRLALADFTGDGVNDIVTAAGPGGGPHVKVFDGVTGDEVFSFFAYAPTFSGGVFVTAGDVNGDGTPDIITGAVRGGGPHVVAFSGKDLTMLASFMAYTVNFHGGVSVAAGDVNADGKADIITGAGPGGGPHVQVFSGADGSVLQSFFAYNENFHGGVNVAAGDFNGDGRNEIVTGPGIGGPPRLIVYDVRTTLPIFDFMAFPAGTAGSSIFSGNVLWSNGLRVAATDVNGDGVPDLVAGPGAGKPASVRVFDGSTTDQIAAFNAFDPSTLGGVFIGGGVK